MVIMNKIFTEIRSLKTILVKSQIEIRNRLLETGRKTILIMRWQRAWLEGTCSNGIQCLPEEMSKESPMDFARFKPAWYSQFFFLCFLSLPFRTGMSFLCLFHHCILEACNLSVLWVHTKDFHFRRNCALSFPSLIYVGRFDFRV
jgi:hypothetical protein